MRFFNFIGQDSTQEVQNTVHTALSQVGNLTPSFTEPYTLVCTFTVQVVLSILTALIGVIIAYGAVGATIIGLLGPVFIHWMVFEKTEFLFWGWLKAFLGFEILQGSCRSDHERHESLAYHLFNQWRHER